MYVFLPSVHLERNISGGLPSKPCQQGCNQCILCVHRDVLRKNKKKFSKKVQTFYPSRKLQWKFRRGGQHYIHWDNRIIMQTIFFKKNTFFLPTVYIERKFFSFSLKTLRRGCNHCIRRVQRKIMRKKNLILRKTLKFYTILGDCEENFGVVVNTAYSETIGTSCRPFFWIICFFYNFCTLSANFSTFAENFSANL